MLSKYDDLFIHQTADSFLETSVTTDMRQFERCYFNIHDGSGEFLMTFGIGCFPNLGIMDGGLAAVSGGRQRNLRLSRSLAGSDRADMAIGPIRFQVLEGLRTWNVALAENDHGVAFDLNFHARSTPFESPRRTHRDGHFTITDSGHYNQAGRYEGWLRIGDRQWEVTPDRFYGHRDRSWGIRPVFGLVRPGRNPAADLSFIPELLLWLTVQFEDRAISLFYMESADGEAGHLSGRVKWDDGRMSAEWVEVDHDIEIDPVSRVHRSSVIRLTDADGAVVTLQARQLLPGIYMAGMGYAGQGAYFGELHIEGEQWDLDIPPEEHLRRRNNMGVDQLAEFRSGDDVAYGVYEHYVSAAHPRYR
jgi:hypothetical protein